MDRRVLKRHRRQVQRRRKAQAKAARVSIYDSLDQMGFGELSQALDRVNERLARLEFAVKTAGP